MTKNAAHLNRAIAGAWPPAEVIEHDGWLFRATAGITRREQRGYIPTARTSVLGADCLAALRQVLIDKRWAVETTSAVTDAWFDVWSAESDRSTAENEIVREVLLQPENPAVFAVASNEARRHDIFAETGESEQDGGAGIVSAGASWVGRHLLGRCPTDCVSSGETQ